MANKFPPGATWITAGGGFPSVEDLDAAKKTFTTPPKGIFGAYPGYTPKYAINSGEQEKDFRETMARMFLQVPNYKEFLKSLGSDPALKQLASVLGGQASDAGGTTGGSGYMDFLLQGVQHSFQEKAQVIEVLTDDHVAYFFGQAAPVFNYNGTLINTKQDDQAVNMLRLYKNFGRGSQLAARNTLISLRYDGQIVSGVMMNLTYSLNSEMETAIPFSFSLLVKTHQLLPNPYAGIVSLSTPFAAAADGYTPFAQPVLNPGTTPTSPAMVPSVATELAITPAAPGPTAAEKDTAEAAAGVAMVKKMDATTTVSNEPPDTSKLHSTSFKQ